MKENQPTLNSKLEKKICLCMIVKNESKIIERCLDSAKSIIDFVSICDTGSTDGTPELIENWCKKNSIPGLVHHQPFKNFGYNRTLSVSLAQDSYPESDYLLLLDADMNLKIDQFDKNNLHHNQYLTMQYDNQIKYWLTRLLKTSLPWKSVGVTHEYWDLDRSKVSADQYFETKGKLDSLIIYDHRDGGSRVDKSERDKRLLIEGINDQTTPIDVKSRYMFYLAQTYSNLNELEEAIKWYKKRVKAGGWLEEVFYSLFQIGMCYERLYRNASTKRELLMKDTHNSKNDQSTIEKLRTSEEQYFALATNALLNAWEYRPCRSEPLYYLAKMYRIKGKNNTGLMYALQGKEIPFPKDDLLFVDYHVYDYLFDYEISICANYIKSKLELGRAAQNRLLSKINQLPLNIARTVENNSKFY